MMTDYWPGDDELYEHTATGGVSARPSAESTYDLDLSSSGGGSGTSKGYHREKCGVFRSDFRYGWDMQDHVEIQYVSGEDFHIERCPHCTVLVECNWHEDLDEHFVGWVCAVCDTEVDNQYDPTPE